MIEYDGKMKLEDKINELLIEMTNNKDLIYTIHIHESRENEAISKLLIEVSDIKNAMPDF
jgi:hypothetical protein